MIANTYKKQPQPGIVQEIVFGSSGFATYRTPPRVVDAHTLIAG